MSEIDEGIQMQILMLLRINRAAQRGQGTRLTPEEVEVLAAMMEGPIIAARVAANHDSSQR